MDRSAVLQAKNGSGKTMLMRVIAGLVSPSTGKLLFDGKNRADANPNIGIMIENASLYPELSGRENLRLLASIRKQATNEDIDQAIRRVGLEPTDKRTFRKIFAWYEAAFDASTGHYGAARCTIVR